MPPHRPPRIDIVTALAEAALKAMEDTAIDGISPGEVLSAAFTLTSRICKEMISVEDDRFRELNINAITDAVANLYAILPEKTIH